MPDVRLVNVSKRFGKIVAVDRVDLYIHDGEYLTLLGPSGCGKTTTLRIIAGLTSPDEGEVYISERLVNNVPPEERGIGFVFQLFAAFPHMTVWDNVAYGPRIAGWDPEEVEKTTVEVLKKVHILSRANAYPSELSLGELQRVGLARALATGAKLLLLDEPLGALDLKIRQELRIELRNLVKGLGLTAVHVTHDQEEAMTISDRIAVMRGGKILQVGKPEELYNYPNNVFVANFIGEANFLEGTVTKSKKDALEVELRGGIVIKTPDSSFKKGEKVVIVIRPENLDIEAGGKRGLNRLQGRVERSKCIGWLTRFEVKLDNGEQIVIEEPVSKSHIFDEGEEVTVSFEKGKALIYHYPEEGLVRALALE